MPPALTITQYTDDMAEAFYQINAQWIESMFTLEANDRAILANPRGTILDGGGVIKMVSADGLGIIGTCALMNAGNGAYELTKMGVSESARGLGAGAFLLTEMIEVARRLPATTLYLLTNWQCAAAVHLYEKLGFVHSEAIKQTYGARYDRCNVAMAYPF